jgi:type IV pilus assembly protein PilB
LATAFANKGTDIHIEPENFGDGSGRVRIRVDGDCTVVGGGTGRIPQGTMSHLFMHIKDLCKMTEQVTDTQDTALAVRFVQDERVRVLKLRVSAMPVNSGRAQSIVLRLLDTMTTSLDELDIAKDDRKVINWAIERDHGVVYVTGPTGSGKTTTLYSCLAELNKPNVTILTAEDPIEYEMDGVRQSQINPSVGFTFAQALRSMLRQDPDIILVGETRDAETASMLLAAAETGHLCFTTLHTNSALAVLTRMETFASASGSFDRHKIISSSLLFLAQRLTRRVCSQCYSLYDASPEERALFEREGVPFSVSGKLAAKGEGCLNCSGRGMVRRTAIMEMVPVIEGGEIHSAIVEGWPVSRLRKLANEKGYKTLFQSALAKAAAYQIPMSEALAHNPELTI